jgi:hypothetical protein
MHVCLATENIIGATRTHARRTNVKKYFYVLLGWAVWKLAARRLRARAAALRQRVKRRH